MSTHVMLERMADAAQRLADLADALTWDLETDAYVAASVALRHLEGAVVSLLDVAWYVAAPHPATPEERAHVDELVAIARDERRTDDAEHAWRAVGPTFDRETTGARHD